MMEKPAVEVGIIGAGFAGLVAALRLKKEGRTSFVIFERAAEVGGTWRDNVYPGCACDVASPLYSFADEPNPNWSSLYAAQPEILAYLKQVVDRRELRKHIRFHSDIVEATFLSAQGCWQVRDRAGYTTTVGVLLLGLGPLNRPHLPKFPGMEQFKGVSFHSAEWDSRYSLQGKRVAVIGTGASAIQIVPSIAPEVEHLTVLQRTPAWVAFRNDRAFTKSSHWLFRKLPFLQKALREALYWSNEFIGMGFTGNKLINRFVRWLSLRKLMQDVKDPEIRKKLMPTYTLGCKRILRSDDYYPTFNRPNVALVTSPIERFTEKGILTADGSEHVLDVVVFATGFVAADFNFSLQIVGLEGRKLKDEWQEKGAEAYLGTTLAGYPNLGILLGPNTGLGHNSVVHMMESQMNYLMQYLKYLEQAGAGTYLDVRQEVQEGYNRRIQQQFRGTVWASGCSSWYLNKEGKNTTLYPRLTVNFRRKTSRFDPRAYRLVQPATEKRNLHPLTV